MKNLLTCAAVVGALFAGSTAVTAQQSEIFVLGSGSSDDDTFAMGSYRYTFGSNGADNNGFAIGVSARTIDYFDGVMDVTIASQRAMVGYRFSAIENSVTTVMVGFENVSSSDETGGILAIEHWNGLSNGDSFFVIAEFAEVNEQVYVSGNYAFSFDGFAVGPVVSYLSVDNYTATDIGIQGNVSLGGTASLIPAIMYRTSEAGGNPSQTTTVASLGLYVSF